MNKNPFFDEQPTKTEETKAFYLKRATSFRLRCAKHLRIKPDNITTQQIADYLVKVAPKLSQSTVRLYKSMLLYYFDIVSDEQSESAISTIQAISVTESPKKTRKTSGLRGKSLSEKTFAAVIYALNLPEHKSKWNLLTSLWLQAGALTGLRPHEWQHAEIVDLDGNMTLKVRNGKTTNNRSHGEYRHINLEECSSNEKRILEQFLAMIEPYTYSSDEFQYVQGRCMENLRKLNLRLEKGNFFTAENGFAEKRGSGVYHPNNKGMRVQLYTGRHRFSSVMKRVAGLAEMAALMGHKTDKTATIHYGRTDVSVARTRRRPKPIAEEVARVERKHALNFIERPQQTQTATLTSEQPSAPNNSLGGVKKP